MRFEGGVRMASNLQLSSLLTDEGISFHSLARGSGVVLRKSIFVEIVRLLAVLLFTASGYGLGMRLGSALFGTIVGAGIGYVCGGIVGRFLRRAVIKQAHP